MQMKRDVFKWKYATKTWCNILCSIKLWLHWISSWIAPVALGISSKCSLGSVSISLSFSYTHTRAICISVFQFTLDAHIRHYCSRIKTEIATKMAKKNVWCLNQMRMSYSFLDKARYDCVSLCVCVRCARSLILSHRIITTLSEPIFMAIPL